jgi:hypothetical protein
MDEGVSECLDERVRHKVRTRLTAAGAAGRNRMLLVRMHTRGLRARGYGLFPSLGPVKLHHFKHTKQMLFFNTPAAACT